MLRSGLIATKMGNTSYYLDDGTSSNVTVLKVDECIVANIKTQDKHNFRIKCKHFDRKSSFLVEKLHFLFKLLVLV